MNFLKKKPKIEVSPKVQTANEFVNVKDIQNRLLYTKDHYVFAYIRVPPVSRELMSETEQEIQIRNLSVALSTEQKPFKLLAISRPVNISDLIDDMTDAYLVADTPQQKELLKNDIDTVNGFALSGDVMERQFYFIIWEGYYDGVYVDLLKRAEDFCAKVASVQKDVKILEDHEIVQLCNLFANPGYAHFEQGEIVPSFPLLGGIAP